MPSKMLPTSFERRLPMKAVQPHSSGLKRLLFCLGILGLVATGYAWRTFPTVLWLCHYGHRDSSGIPYARSQLKSKHPDIRRAAAQALGTIGPTSYVAVPDLLVALNDTSPEVASTAAWALGFAGNDIRGHTVIDALIQSTDHPDVEVRRYSCLALALWNDRAAIAVPALVRRLDDPHTASAAASALGEIGGPARRTIPKIAELLTSRHNGDRAEAVNALMKLQPLPEDVFTAAEKLLRDEDSLVRDIAHRAFQSISPPTKRGN